MKEDWYLGFNIADLIVKRLEGKLSKEEEQTLEDWKYAKEENLVLFHRLSQNPEKQFFNRENKLEDSHKEQVWEKIRLSVKRQKRTRILNSFMKIAAVFVIVLGSVFFFSNLKKSVKDDSETIITPGKNLALLVMGDGEKYELDKEVQLQESGVKITNDSDELVYQKAEVNNKAKKQLTYNTIIIPKGGEYKLTLMDGTKIWLNSNSKLRYPSVFGSDVRKVQLEGEAYFQVAKDSLHPFIVDVNNVQVKVLGTSFNVNAYGDDDEIVTTLLEGKVEVKDEFFGNMAKLLPNEQFRFNKLNGKCAKNKVDAKIYAAWTNGRFVFENESLQEIMNRLSRWYDVEVFFLNNDAKNLKFSGDVARYENINQILEMIEVTQKVKFTIKDRSLMVEKI
ncbi:FecR family protein [Ancylomarina longa]|uniref:FecR family protein n=1 Tax=Ancylomarina longa TaxID=2487017 RepID=A0A434AUC0_9BACT|nr:FecR family protein [Ancylomarina longa]RUT78037.1 FecR family protein [Ancylomarina longa]